MSNISLNSWVKTLFNNLYLYNTILEAYNKQILEVALGINVKAWEFNYNYNELEGLPLLRDILYFNNE